jgi:hypothetical protein
MPSVPPDRRLKRDDPPDKPQIATAITAPSNGRTVLQQSLKWGGSANTAYAIQFEAITL